MNKQEWNGNILRVERDYEWPNPYTSVSEFERLSMEQEGERDYDCAVNGESFSLKTVSGSSCIALVEDALNELYEYHSYVIWPLKNRSAANLRKWNQKWARTTAKEVTT